MGCCSSQSGFCRPSFQFDWSILELFLWPSIYLAIVVSGFIFCSAFHRAPLILNASLGCGAVGGGSCTFFYQALLVVLFWLAFQLHALQRWDLSVFSECCFLELLARLSSIRILLISGFVVLFSILWGSVLPRVVFVGLLSDMNASF